MSWAYKVLKRPSPCLSTASVSKTRSWGASSTDRDVTAARVPEEAPSRQKWHSRSNPIRLEGPFRGECSRARKLLCPCRGGRAMAQYQFGFGLLAAAMMCAGCAAPVDGVAGTKDDLAGEQHDVASQSEALNDVADFRVGVTTVKYEGDTPY